MHFTKFVYCYIFVNPGYFANKVLWIMNIILIRSSSET